jgi:sugar lactone lactonase YvrE
MPVPPRMIRSIAVALPLLALAGAAQLPGQQTEGREVSAPRVTTIVTSEPLPSQGRLGGVAVDQSGNVFVSNFGATVWRVAPDGSVTTLASTLRGSSGNAVDSEGNLLQASFLEGRIVRIAPNGSTSDLVSSGLDGPIGLTVADDGSVYVCQCRRNSVARVAPDGSVSEFASSEDFDCPNGITIGPDGALYVVSFNNGYVVRVDKSGRAARFATVPDGRNAHIAHARGAFWVTKIEANLLYRVDADGQATRYAGTGELGFDDGTVGEAPLARPNGIAVLPEGDGLVVNTLDGPWRGNEATRIVLRRVELTVVEEVDLGSVPPALVGW